MSLDNLSDISVLSVKTDDLRNSDEVEERNDQHELDTPPMWNADKAPITVCGFEEPVGPTLTLSADKTELDNFFLRYCMNN